MRQLQIIPELDMKAETYIYNSLLQSFWIGSSFKGFRHLELKDSFSDTNCSIINTCGVVCALEYRDTK